MNTNGPAEAPPAQGRWLRSGKPAATIGNGAFLASGPETA